MLIYSLEQGKHIAFDFNRNNHIMINNKCYVKTVIQNYANYCCCTCITVSITGITGIVSHRAWLGHGVMCEQLLQNSRVQS